MSVQCPLKSCSYKFLTLTLFSLLLLLPPLLLSFDWLIKFSIFFFLSLFRCIMSLSMVSWLRPSRAPFPDSEAGKFLIGASLRSRKSASVSDSRRRWSCCSANETWNRIKNFLRPSWGCVVARLVNYDDSDFRRLQFGSVFKLVFLPMANLWETIK